MLKINDLTRWAEELSSIDLIQEIDQLKAVVDSHRPISKEIQDRIFQKFRLDWNYNSNAIEGNKLTYGETVALLMHGVTAKGKPLKDHLDVKGHNKGINLLLDIVKSKRDFTQNDIRSLHEIILVESYSSKTVTPEGIPATRKINIGQYKTVPNHVKTVTGEMHYYASPAETPVLMNELIDWYEATKKNDKIHPFITASLFHYAFVAIHPFDDGNGRMTRILMNLILMRNHYPPIIVPLTLREKYYGVLSEADSEDFLPMTRYFGELLSHSLNIQLKGIKGESIAEPDDIDKKIELFRKSLDKKLVHQSRNAVVITSIIYDSIVPLLKKIEEKSIRFKDLFIDCFIKIKIDDSGKSYRYTYAVDLKRFYSDLNQIREDASNIKSIKFDLDFRTFKNTENPFNVVAEYFIDFNDLEYIVRNFNKNNLIFSITKSYSQKWSSKDINNILDAVFEEIITKINTSLEEI